MGLERTDSCTTAAGISKLFALKFEKLKRSDFTIENNIITKYPFSVIYKLDFVSGTYDENANESEGGIEVKQNLKFKLLDIKSTDNVINLIKKDVRFIFETNDNKIRIIGLNTGLKGKYTASEGINRSDFKGYDLTFETSEEIQAPFLENMNFFETNTELLINEIIEAIL